MRVLVSIAAVDRQYRRLNTSMKKTLAILNIICICLTTGCSLIQPPKFSDQTNQSQAVILPGKFYFYSATCPHCATVNDFIAQNNVKDRLYYIEAPIDNNPGNIELLQKVGQRCGVSQSELGVPLFWDGKRCYHGSEEVIGYFETIN